MIPKIIHFVWLGGTEKPANIKACIKSWKRHLPDWEFKEWNETSFDINSHPYVKDAINKRKWAFASDYIRLYALSNWGGVYLDTDIRLFKSLNEFLKYDFFTAHECFYPIFESKKHLLTPDGYRIDSNSEEFGGFGIISSVIGCNPNHPFISEMLNFYDNLSPNSSGEYDNCIIDRILALKLEQYGYRYIDEMQSLCNGVTVFTSNMFRTYKKLSIKDTVLFHQCINSWNPLSLKSCLTEIKLKIYQSFWRIQEYLISNKP